VRFEVFMAVRMTMLFFWDVMPCRLAGLHPEDGDSMYLRNVGIELTAIRNFE
jgi:hypothetical protein